MKSNSIVVLVRDNGSEIASMPIQEFIPKFMNVEFPPTAFFIFEDLENKKIAAYDYIGVTLIALQAMMSMDK